MTLLTVGALTALPDPSCLRHLQTCAPLMHGRVPPTTKILATPVTTRYIFQPIPNCDIWAEKSSKAVRSLVYHAPKHEGAEAWNIIIIIRPDFDTGSSTTAKRMQFSRCHFCQQHRAKLDRTRFVQYIRSMSKRTASQVPVLNLVSLF